jgi:CRISPR/Cas system endoribonuclease Cas6 (RAMP superfamily)
MERNGLVKIGKMRFSVDSLRKLNLKAPNNGHFTMITGTPILVRIPQERYEKYAVKPPLNYKYLYRRADHPLELFQTFFFAL